MNQGPRGGMIRYAMVRDCRTDEERAITDNALSFCRPVRRQTRAVENGSWPRHVPRQRATCRALGIARLRRHVLLRPRACSRPQIQRVRREICTPRPNDGPGLGIDRGLREACLGSSVLEDRSIPKKRVIVGIGPMLPHEPVDTTDYRSRQPRSGASLGILASGCETRNAARTAHSATGDVAHGGAAASPSAPPNRHRRSHAACKQRAAGPGRDGAVPFHSGSARGGTLLRFSRAGAASHGRARLLVERPRWSPRRTGQARSRLPRSHRDRPGSGRPA